MEIAEPEKSKAADPLMLPPISRQPSVLGGGGGGDGGSGGGDAGGGGDGGGGDGAGGVQLLQSSRPQQTQRSTFVQHLLFVPTAHVSVFVSFSPPAVSHSPPHPLQWQSSYLNPSSSLGSTPEYFHPLYGAASSLQSDSLYPAGLPKSPCPPLHCRHWSARTLITDCDTPMAYPTPHPDVQMGSCW